MSKYILALIMSFFLCMSLPGYATDTSDVSDDDTEQSTDSQTSPKTKKAAKPVAKAASDAPFKAAAVSFNPKFQHLDANLPAMVAMTEKAAAQGAELIVLPEMASSGYIYRDRNQITPFLDEIPGKTTSALEPIAQKHNAYIIVGIAEIDPTTNLAYNAAALIGPEGYIGKYRKNQLSNTDSTWATRGNMGYPVFDTDLGKISLIIGDDDAYIQSLEIPALRGANIIAHLTASDHSLDQSKQKYTHSNLANMTSLSGWIGTYVVSSNRTDSEINPDTGAFINFSGGSSMWDPDGKQLAQAPISNTGKPNETDIIYATINPKQYNNAAKDVLLKNRRPVLYHDLSLSRMIDDPDASTTPQNINALILQYTPIPLDKEANLKSIHQLLQEKPYKHFNLIVLPQNTLVGAAPSKEMQSLSEGLDGFTVKKMAILAKLYRSYLVFSFPEKYQQKYYETALLMSDEGKIVGVYRKTHLNTDEKTWATPGDDIPVFTSKLGRIGIIIGDEVRIPDIATLMLVKRADIIAVPSSWKGDYAGPVIIDQQFLSKPLPANTMNFWYNLARTAQAYTLVANYVGGDEQYRGGSGLYPPDPFHDIPPTVASHDDKALMMVSFKTLSNQDDLVNQANLVMGRRAELSMPLILSIESECFKNWKKNPLGIRFCWN